MPRHVEIRSGKHAGISWVIMGFFPGLLGGGGFPGLLGFFPCIIRRFSRVIKKFFLHYKGSFPGLLGGYYCIIREIFLGFWENIPAL